MLTVGFGGGCHWCTEAVFQSLRDVVDVRQGFIRSDPPNESFSEAVEVELDPDRISVDALVRVHLATHASAAAHKMRGKYRSAIYVLDPYSEDAACLSLERVRAETGVDFVTQVLPHRGFRLSDARFRNYRAQDPERPFCRTYIDPKLAKLRQEFAELLGAPESAPT